METVNILGINVNTFTKKQVLAKIQEFLTDGRQHQIVTPNPEIILKAAGHDEELFYILNKADLAVPDGVGLKIAGWLMGADLSRITGADLVKDILQLAQEQGRRVAIFNWQAGLSGAEVIKQALADKYPNLQALALDIDQQAVIPEDKLKPVKEFKPEIVFCTLGAPYQEKFIFYNLAKLPSVKIGIGVGGAFDFLSGRIKRAPKILRLIGLEWLWRLIKQPRRWQRICNAVIVFPLKFFLWRFILPWRYRRNVACLLYKPENGKFKILIVERADESGHWQLPQGGTDGENLVKAGSRELREEINTDKFKTVAVFPKINAYKFGEQISRYGVSAKLASGYRGQKQGLFIAEFTGSDADIKVNFWEHSTWRWVQAEKLAEAVHSFRQPAAKIFMEKFRETKKEKRI
ncbi:MAG: WecB/TagA/CpsF family glycosyltransferase [Parcubacteria group bacterium]|nr:WecB/TagA/CpsF family glycosyltransferase [Parcubacteria group bacterium]